jgi:hypothetical protein
MMTSNMDTSDATFLDESKGKEYVEKFWTEMVEEAKSLDPELEVIAEKDQGFILRLYWDHCPLAWDISFLLSNNLRVIIRSDPAHATLNHRTCLPIPVGKIFNHKYHPEFTHAEHRHNCKAYLEFRCKFANVEYHNYSEC